MNKIVVVGSSNTDMVVRSQKIPQPGETVLGTEFDIIQGGKGANQAVAAARAGAKVTFIAKVGNDDFGKNALDGYKLDKINIEHISIANETPTGVAVIIVDSNTGQNSIVVAPGANQCLSETDIEAASSSFKNADVLLAQLEIPMKVVLKSLQLARENGLLTILNPAPAQTLGDELLQLVDYITPNETEAELLTGIKTNNEQGIKLAAEELLKKVNLGVMVTLGSKGVYFVPKIGEPQFIPTQKVDAVDTTAAGDVFNGYLAAGMAKGLSLESAVLSANKAASISVTRKGAQPSIPYYSEIE